MDKIYALNEIQAIVKPILQQYGVSRAYLFGSYACGEATGQSDIDLRIDGGKIKSMFGLGALYDELTNALEKPVDLVTTEGLNHNANRKRTERFWSSMKEDERLIYIMRSVERFGNDKAVFDADRDYRNSVCMSLLQIGELTGHLTEDFREETKKKNLW